MTKNLSLDFKGDEHKALRPYAEILRACSCRHACYCDLTLMLLQDARRPHSDQQQVYNTLKGRLNPIPDRVSPAAQDLVLSMLQTDPARRPSLKQIAEHPCLTEMQPLDAALQFEVRDLPYQGCSQEEAGSDNLLSHLVQKQIVSAHTKEISLLLRMKESMLDV